MTKRKFSTSRRRARPAKGASWLYGVHPVLHALANRDRHCRRLIVTAEARRNLGARLERALAAGDAPPVTTAVRADLDNRLPRDAVHQGLALEVAPLPDTSLDDLLGRLDAVDAAVVVALDQVTDPRNLGAVMRSAAAFGASGVIVPERHAPPAGGALAKAAAGALEHVPLVRVANLARALRDLKDAGFWCLGLDATADGALEGETAAAKIALVLGAEGTGLRRLTGETCDDLVRIPVPGAIDSLNVAAAAAVALYAVSRRS